MAPIMSEGFVLKKINFRETSVILTLFTKEIGKIKGVLKGVRKEKSKISPLTFTPGAYINTLIYKKKTELCLLSSPSLIDFFDFENKISSKIYYLILKLVDLFTPDFQKEEKVFFLIKDVSEMLKKSRKPHIIFIGFKIKFIEILGYGIKTDRCSVCDKETKNYFFSFKKGGIICRNCLKTDINSVKVSKKIVSIMNFIKKTEIKNLDVLNIKMNEAERINHMCNLVLLYHSDLNFIWWSNEKDIFITDKRECL